MTLFRTSTHSGSNVGARSTTAIHNSNFHNTTFVYARHVIWCCDDIVDHADIKHLVCSVLNKRGNAFAHIALLLAY